MQRGQALPPTARRRRSLIFCNAENANKSLSLRHKTSTPFGVDFLFLLGWDFALICYLVRHGKDDESVRGGWCASSLCLEGIAQVEHLAIHLTLDSNFHIGCIFASDLERTKHTAEILNRTLCVPLEYCPQFREVNNGLLAGMKNEIASIQYPGLFWSTLDWEEAYPDGESPKEFYERIRNGWEKFKKDIRDLPYDVMLVTHGGVLNVIQCIEHGIAYSNKANPFPVGYAEMISVEI